MTDRVTHRVVALESVSWTLSPVRESRRTCDLVRRVLTVLVAVADELHVDTMIALTPELTRQTLSVLCVKTENPHTDNYCYYHFHFQFLFNQPTFTELLQQQATALNACCGRG